MRSSPRKAFAYIPILIFTLFLAGAGQTAAQSAGSITGTVADSTGASIPGASVTVKNPVSGLNRTVKTDATGHFVVPNLPQSNYSLIFAAPGFATAMQTVEVHSVVAVNVP